MSTATKEQMAAKLEQVRQNRETRAALGAQACAACPLIKTGECSGGTCPPGAKEYATASHALNDGDTGLVTAGGGGFYQLPDNYAKLQPAQITLPPKKQQPVPPKPQPQQPLKKSQPKQNQTVARAKKTPESRPAAMRNRQDVLSSLGELVALVIGGVATVPVKK